MCVIGIFLLHEGTSTSQVEKWHRILSHRHFAYCPTSNISFFMLVHRMRRFPLQTTALKSFMACLQPLFSCVKSSLQSLLSCLKSSLQSLLSSLKLSPVTTFKSKVKFQNLAINLNPSLKSNL